MPAAPRPHRPDVGRGLLLAALVLAIYGGVAVSVDFPRASVGFYSDEATYYMMGHSLAEDGDLAYRREDLVRVWREFPSGPLGLFLKRGRDVGVSRQAGFPFVRAASAPDPDAGRLFFGKSFIYPLVAWPFVRALGTNGFLVLHAVLLALVTFAAYLFVQARARPLVAALVSTAFVQATVVPLYFVWIMPEVFNFACVALAFFLWLYKAVAPEAQLPRGLRWLLGDGSDLVAAVLLGFATFSKPSHVLLVGPPLAWLLWRRGPWLRTGAVFALVVGGLFAANMAVAGEWNYQGGERVTCYLQFPFSEPGRGLDVCADRATDRVPTEVIFNWQAFWTVLRHNLAYVFVGRYSGLLPYYFPALFALVLFPLRRRTGWEWMVLAAGLAELLLFVIWTPYTYSGGGGSVGNRYFVGAYGAFLVLLPAVSSAAAALVPWVGGALFTAQLTLNPFWSSFRPAEHAKQGPLRLLPVELSLVNDLPINTNPGRVRVLFGDPIRFQIYYLDDNAYDREGNTLWVHGDAAAEFLVKHAGTARALSLGLQGGPGGTDVTLRVAGRTERIRLGPDEARVVQVPLGDGFPYQGTRVWWMRVRVRGGFVPLFTGAGLDHRYLGVMLTPNLVP